MQEFVPPHTPHLSVTAVPLALPWQSYVTTQSLLRSASHLPHSSVLFLPFTAPAQSTQALEPPHTPQRSRVPEPPHTALQSALQSFEEFVSHTPQRSRLLL